MKAMMKIFVCLFSLLLLLSAMPLAMAEAATAVETEAVTQTEALPDETETETVAPTEEADTEAKILFTPGNFVSNLKYMAAGMAGIFLVIGVIILTIVLLGKLTAPRGSEEDPQ